MNFYSANFISYLGRDSDAFVATGGLVYRYSSSVETFPIDL